MHPQHHPTSAAQRRQSLRRALLGAALLATAYAPLASAERPAISVRDPWIRLLPAGLPASAYMRLDNHSSRPVTLVNADSPGHYSSVALHRTVKMGAISTMKAVDRVVIPAHGHLRLAPGGYHIMLLNAKHPVEPGQQLPITLRFADGSRVTARFLVRKAGDGPQPQAPSRPRTDTPFAD